MTVLKRVNELVRRSIETLEGLDGVDCNKILIHPNVFLFAYFSDSLGENGKLD